MGLLAPLFLLGALAAAIPVVLHLFARDTPESVPFSTVRFLRPLQVEQTRRRRLSDLLLLALRVAALVLLALSFARPFFTGSMSTAAQPITIVAVDRSFSVSADSTWREVRGQAKAAVDGAPSGREVGLVAFDDTSDVVVLPTTDRGVVLAAIDRLTPGAGATRYAAALAGAREALGRRPGQIVLVTDTQRPGRHEEPLSVPGDVSVTVREVALPPGNLAVTTLQRAERGVSAVVANFGAVERTTRAVLFVGDARVASTDVRVSAGGATDVVLDAKLPATGVARFVVDDPEGPRADDERVLVLDPPRPTRVLLVADVGRVRHNGFYVERALGATDEDEAYTVDVQRADDPALDDSRAFAEADVVALLATRGLSRSARLQLADWVEAGGGLLVAAGPDTEPGQLRDVLRAVPSMTVASLEPTQLPASFAPVDVRHPVLAALGPYAGALAQVRLDSGVDLGEGDGVRVVARLTNGRPGIVEVGPGKGRALVVASDLGRAWNQFPLQPTFVPFVHEVMRYLARPAPPRDMLVADVPAGSPRVAGVLAVGSPPVPVAVNVDLNESTLDRLGARALVARVARTDPPLYQPGKEREAREAEQALWRYGLILLAGVLAIEGMVGGRSNRREFRAGVSPVDSLETRA